MTLQIRCKIIAIIAKKRLRTHSTTNRHIVINSQNGGIFLAHPVLEQFAYVFHNFLTIVFLTIVFDNLLCFHRHVYLMPHRV